jgi:hypothetical protein
VSVVADPEAVAFIASHGGCLYIYADPSGRKHASTDAPNDPAIRFAQIEANGFLMYVEKGTEQPETWTVTLSHLPHHHLDVLWDGHPEHPHLERTVCMMTGHNWKPDPDSTATDLVILCQRCGRRRELSERPITGTPLAGWRPP